MGDKEAYYLPLVPPFPHPSSYLFFFFFPNACIPMEEGKRKRKIYA